MFITKAAMIRSVGTPGDPWRDSHIKRTGVLLVTFMGFKKQFWYPPHPPRCWYLLARLLSNKRSTVGALMVPFRVVSQKSMGGPYSENCDQGLEAILYYTIRTDPKPVNNLFIFFQALKLLVTVTLIRDRKIRTALRNNQIVGFVTVLVWKKIKCVV